MRRIFHNLISLVSLVFYFSSYSQPIKILDGKFELPRCIMYDGKLKSAIHWLDRSGENIAVISESGEFPSPDNDHENYRDAELYAFHYWVIGGTIKRTWKIKDSVKQCPVDIYVSFVKNTFQVTDLNENGIAEVWLLYRVSCHGDVSPAQMKIIMYEEQKKYAMRGRTKVKISDRQWEGGEYILDNNFNTGPQKFIEFAKQLWSNNVLQEW